ncbi:MAG TPA: DUF1501 domain-containing protein [Gemmatimonadaceae bacterium]|jgi:uncharacterized protein (DUF1501 family)|nr:DUF1501 domain-containing protein [Gemmatimonadaceae bacterium]
MQRRAFVKSGALALVTMGLSPRFLRRTALGTELPGAAKGKILICLFQRGAADALNVVVPHGDASYYALRPRIAIARPSVRVASGQSAIDLDGFFGLHPSLRPLEPLWNRGLLAPVHAVGSPSATRSHFDAQDYMESGTPDVKGTPDGWLNRYLATRGTCEECAAPSARPSPFQAVALTNQTPRILEGEAPAVAMTSIETFTVRAGGASAAQLEALYRTGTSDLVHASGSEMFEAVKMLRAANPQRYQPEHGAEYPRSQFGQRLREIAQLVKANVGLEVAFADVGGWDTHVNQGGATGQLANRLSDFARSIAALTTDLGDRMEDVVILTMSEFGRMARENGTGGTDHGHAGAMFVIGGPVRGGRVHGAWPGLDREQLFEGRDLALTTDFRAVFGEVVSEHLGATKLDRIFPGFTGGSSVGVL